jgi:HD-like signal output (HDOD) protein
MLTISVADRERIALFRAEEKTLGMNHCGAGAMIVKAWKLEGPVGEVIINHHNCNEYEGEYTDILFTIAAANRFASIMEIGFSGDRYPEKNEIIWDTLGIDPDVFDRIEQTVNDEIEKAKVFLKL